MSDPRQSELRERDAASMKLLGGFFCVLAVLVLIGSIWSTGRPHAMVVNIGAGTLMLVVGSGMLWIGTRLRRPLAPTAPNETNKTT